MKVTYEGPLLEIELPDGVVVQRNHTVEVDNHLGAELVKRGDFKKKAEPKSEPRAKPATSHRAKAHEKEK